MGLLHAAADGIVVLVVRARDVVYEVGGGEGEELAVRASVYSAEEQEEVVRGIAAGDPGAVKKGGEGLAGAEAEEAG